jgi:hypothetical protein
MVGEVDEVEVGVSEESVQVSMVKSKSIFGMETISLMRSEQTLGGDKLA